MPVAERLAVQSDLAWIGDYEGPPGGDFTDERVIDAVKLVQKAAADKETGILNDEERARLAAAAKAPQAAVGWQFDRRSGNRRALRPARKARCPGTAPRGSAAAGRPGAARSRSRISA